MPRTRPPNPPFVLDSATVTTALCDNPTNENIGIIEYLFESGDVHISSQTRKEIRDYNPAVWNRHQLDRTKVQARDQKIREVVGQMNNECWANGLNPSDKAMAPKMFILCIAKVNGGTIVSIDGSNSEISMRSLCRVFNIDFCLFDELEMYA